MISTSKISILLAIAGSVVASPIYSATGPSQHRRQATNDTVPQRKGLSTGGIIAIVVCIVVVVILFGVAALLLSRRRRRIAKLKADHATTGAPIPNAPGPNYLPPMPELESGATTTTPGRRPKQPAAASLGMPPVPPSAARTSKLQRPPSPDAIRFPTPKMPQPSFNGGFAVARHDGPVAAATVSPYGAQPAIREPGFR